MSLPPGTALNQYEIVALLGAGGMGEVYLADDVQLKRRLALKILPAEIAVDADRARRFEQEARAASALNHPNIVTVYALGSAPEGRFIAMELVQGRTLRDMAGRPWTVEDVARIGRQVAEALRVAHAAGIAHRDIKPENIMVRDDGYVKVLDFGLARLMPTGLDTTQVETVAGTLPGTVLGTLRYMSPEQARAETAGNATDIFALGLVLYELATGTHAFAAESPLLVSQGILSDTPLAPSRLNAEIPEPLEVLILQMLQKNPHARPTAADVVGTLSELATTTVTVGVRQREVAHSRRFVVGRENELAALHGAFLHVTQGHGQLLAVAGEPGAGKTTVIEAFLSEIGTRSPGCRIARGRCSERLAGTEAYGAWLEALTGLMLDARGEVARAMRLLASTWYEQIAPMTSADSSSSRLSAEPAAASQERLKRELTAVLQELTRSEPLVLLFEDIHWADPSTVDLLGFVADRFDTLRTMVLVSYRPSDLQLAKHPFAQLKQSLQARGICRDLNLQFLDVDGVARYLALQFPDNDFPSDLASQIHARTEGHPLFVSDLVRYLRDREAITRNGDRWAMNRSLDEIGGDLPESVRGMIDRKIGQLDDEDRRLLAAASVQGAEFDSTIVAAALAQDAAEVEERLDVLDRVHAFVRLVDERELPDHTLSSRYRFVHVLYQNALYGSLRPTRRAHVAGAVALALERHWGDQASSLASDLAVLFETARNFSRAAEYFHLAAQDASRLFAAREAVTLAREALAMLERLSPDRDRFEHELSTLIILGNALIATGGYSGPDVKDTYERAMELCAQLGDTPQRLPALWGSFQFRLMRARYAEVLEHAQDFLPQFEGDPAIVIGHRVIGQAWLFSGNPDRGRDHFERIVSIYDPAQHRPLTWLYAQEPGMAGHALLGLTLWLLGYPDRALAHSEESLRLGKEVPHYNSRANALVWAAIHHQWRREPERVQEMATQVTTLATEQGLRFWLAVGVYQLGAALVAHDRSDEGLEKMHRGLAGYQAAGAMVLHTFNLGALAAAYGQAGKPEQGLATLDEAQALVSETGEHFWEAELHRLRGELVLMAGGDAVQGQSSFQQAIDIARTQRARSLELRATTSLARLRHSQGDVAQAREMLAGSYNWFAEGHDTPDLKEARALLEQLG